MIPKFELNNVPDEFEVEISQGLVDALDRINCPFKYNDKKRGRNVIWKAESKFYKRLWGWGRYRSTGGRGKYRDGDNGAFLKNSHVAEILEYTNCPWWFLEDNIVAIRQDAKHQQLVTRLPITADKWWAKLMGIYWSSGSISYIDRGGKGPGGKKYIETVVRFAVDPDVVPMLREIGTHIGDNHIHEATYVPVYDGPAKEKHLRWGVRQPVLFSTPVAAILHKFGLPKPPIQEHTGGPGGGRKIAHRNFDPSIPEWIATDVENMHAFIEGYINGQRGNSIMNTINPGQRGVSTQVLIRFRGWPEEATKKFGETFVEWFNHHGITGYFRKLQYRKPPKPPEYEFIIHNYAGLEFILDNFEIRRPDMRARLILRVKGLGLQAPRMLPSTKLKRGAALDSSTPEKYALMQVIKELNSQQIVLLGMLYERPRTHQELFDNLRLRPQILGDILTSLQNRGVVIKNGDHYEVDLTEWAKRTKIKLVKKEEQLISQIGRLSVKLLYQCEECGRVYVNHRTVCGICGSDVDPVERTTVLRPLVYQRHRANRKVSKLSKVIK